MIQVKRKGLFSGKRYGFAECYLCKLATIPGDMLNKEERQTIDMHEWYTLN
jgi:hypothetical protein